MIVYINGRFVAKEEAGISPEDRGFMFADGIYEVVRSYEGRLFRADEHFVRMERSLGELRIGKPAGADFVLIAGELMRRNHLEGSDSAFYVQITRGVAGRSHSFPEKTTDPTVYACLTPIQKRGDESERGVKIILVPDNRWARCDIKSIALLPNVLANQRAKENSAEEAVFVRDGVITEGTHTNVCAVINGLLVTHPNTNHILAGITRGVVLGLCDKLGIPYEERALGVDELRQVDELMIVGTSSEVMPVVEVDDWTVADGTPGPITRKLQRAFREEVAL
jgi:D-alanine transaminase